MLARSDIVDIFLKVINGLSPSTGPLPTEGSPMEKTGGKKALRRIFISDWELKRLYKPAEKSVHVPQCAIISPLSRDWLEYEGIEVIFDETGR